MSYHLSSFSSANLKPIADREKVSDLFKKNWHNQKGFQERPPPILP
nr:MAG TPA: hypothetical protein [Caudoviricetes sp.]